MLKMSCLKPIAWDKYNITTGTVHRMSVIVHHTSPSNLVLGAPEVCGLKLFPK